MKLASFRASGRAGYGIVSADGVRPAGPDFLAEFPTLRDAIAGGALDRLAGACGAALPLAEITLLPPIPNPGRIVCAGMNYRKVYPVEGVAPPAPDNIVIFARHTDSLVGHGAMLEQPRGAAAETFDFEGEIAVVIGRAGRHIAEERAMEHVLGYSPMNEGSVRGWMRHAVHAGKNFHASGSWGPWITTTDETGDFPALGLEVRLNGRVMQKATAAEMIFTLPELIAYISHIMPLAPGDVIATGSPDGTGGSRKPPVFLAPDDLVEVEVTGVGTLANRVAANTGD